MRIIGLLSVIAYLLAASCSLGIVLHNDDEPTDKPADTVVGRWSTNASCVVIERNYVLASKHQSGSIGDPVEISGRTYTIAQRWNHSTADLQIARLRHANIADHVELYTSSDERNKPIVMAGYGDGRGNPRQTGGVTYGYQWDNSENTNLRSCTNKIDQVYVDGFIKADFDDLGVSTSTSYEGAVADHDSGCGWFIDTGSQWKVAGISHGVEYFGISRFRDVNDPNILDADELWATRVSSYASWVDSVIQSQPQCDYMAADLNDDCTIDIEDLEMFVQWWLHDDCGLDNNFCEGADFEPVNGKVDLLDFADFANYWLEKD